MSHDRLNYTLNDFGRQCVLGEIESVRRWLENRHSVTLPEFDVICSDNITKAISLFPPVLPGSVSVDMEQKLLEDLDRRLELQGLTLSERCRVGLSRFTIFLPKDHLARPLERCEDIWHETAHAAAQALGLKDEQYVESFAVTYSLIGLLQGAKVGKFSLNEVFDQIEHVIKKVHLSFPLLPHHWTLKFVEKYNPDLKFRGRRPEELLNGLNETIKDIVNTDREVHAIMQNRKLARFEKPAIALLGAVAATLLIASLVLSLFRLV